MQTFFYCSFLRVVGLLILFLFKFNVVFCIESTNLVNIDEIIQNHIAAIGSPELLKNIRSMRAVGQKIQNNEYEFYSEIKKDVNLYKCFYERKGFRKALSYDGTELYIVVGEKVLKEPNIQTFPFLAMNIPLFDHLVSKQNNQSVITFLGMKSIQGTRVYHLLIKETNDLSIEYFIDANTYLIKQRAFLEKTENGESHYYSEQFEDYQNIYGLQLAMSRSCFKDGHLTHKIRFSNIDFNIGVGHEFFIELESK